jgi:hypothetical protein
MQPDLRYVSRAVWFGAAETWSLSGETLTRCDRAGRPLRGAALREVRAMRLFRPPSRFMANFAGCELSFADGSRARILSGGSAGHAAAYRAFVTALAPAIRRANPACLFRLGRREPRHSLRMLALLAVILAWSWAVATIAGMPAHDAGWLALVAGGLFLIHAVVAHWAGRRGAFVADAIPPRILPRGRS